MSRLLSTVLGLALALTSLRVSASAPADTIQRVETMRGNYETAQTLIEQYRRTGERARLEAASDLLRQWLAEHEAIYGHGSDALAQRQPVVQQLAQLEDILRPIAPAPAVAPAPAPPRQPRPEPTPMDKLRLQRARAMMGWGGVSLGLGLLGVAGGAIAWGLRRTALERADRQRFYTREQTFVDRARRRHNMAFGFGITGGILTLTGMTLMITGRVIERRVSMRLAVAPAFGPTYGGVAARVRF